MKTISIQVPPNIAYSFEHAEESKKRLAEVYINAWLSDFFDNTPANEKLTNIMQQSSREAKSNGFTPDMMDDLLKDEE